MSKNIFPLNEFDCRIAGPWVGPNGPGDVNIGVGIPYRGDISKLTCVLKGPGGELKGETALGDPLCRDYWFRFKGLLPGGVYSFRLLAEDGEEIEPTGGLDSRDQFFTAPKSPAPDDQLAAISCHDPFAGASNDINGWDPATRLFRWIDDNRQTANLGLQLGDQVYQDRVAEWAIEEIRKKGDTEEVRKEVMGKLIENAIRFWSHPDYRRCFMQVPNLVTADDHDYYDGIGSISEQYDEQNRLKPEYQAYKECASRVFWAYQARRNPPVPAAFSGTTTTYLDIGSTRVWMLDLRSERNITKNEVMSPGKEAALLKMLHNTPERIKTVILGLPVVAVRMDPKIEDSIVFASRLLKAIKGLEGMVDNPILKALLEAEIEDDTLDSLSSLANRDFLAKVMDAVAPMAARGTKVGILTGDIHEPGFSELYVKSTTGVEFSVFQVVASPFTNEPKNVAVSRLLGAQHDFDIPNRVGVEMVGRNGPYNPKRGFATFSLMSPETVTFHLEDDYCLRELALSMLPRKKPTPTTIARRLLSKSKNQTREPGQNPGSAGT